MASRVNTRFVVILSVVLCAVFVGVAWLAYERAGRSPDRLMALGDAAAAADDWKKAEEWYSKAVNKDQTNTAYLEKWIDAMEHLTPETRQDYQALYVDMYRGALGTLAQAKGEDVSGYERFLEEMYQRLRTFGADLKRWEQFATLVGDAIKDFPGSEADKVVLRRYRAMARLGMLETGYKVTPEVRAETEADLKAALARNPKDETAVTGLAMLLRDQARTLQMSNQAAAAEAELGKARAMLAEHLAANPTATRVAADLLFMDLNAEVRGGATSAAALEKMKPVMEQAVAAIKATPSAELEPAPVVMTATLASKTPGMGPEAGLELYDHALKADPSDAFLLMQKANYLQGIRRPAEAEEIYRKIAELPDRPMSMEGFRLYMLRDQALSKQIDSLIGQLSPTADEATKKELIGKAKEIRAKLAATVPADSPLLLFVDGKLAYAQDELSAARTLLTQYAETTQDGLPLLMLGEVLRRQNNMGAARQEFEAAARRLEDDYRPHLGLARVALAEQKYEEASKHIAKVLELDPGNEGAIEVSRTLAQVAKGTGSEDPIIRDLSVARDLVIGEKRDLPKAAEILKASVAANGHDPRLVSLLVQVLGLQGQREEALGVVEAAIAAHPENETFKQMRAALQHEDPTDAALAAVDQMEKDEVRRALMRHEILRRSGKAEAAEAEIEKARTLAPEDAMVVDYLFQRAVLKKDSAEVARLTDLGVRKNLDNLRGLTFLARQAMSELRYGEALTFLRQAVELDKLNPMIHRYLGDVNLAMGQTAEALKSYREAARLRPGDAAVVKGVMRAQMRSGDSAGALATARENMALTDADDELAQMWLELEEKTPGGDPARAQAVREQNLLARPDDTRNRVLLILSLLGRGELDQAAAQLEAARPMLKAPAVAELEARLLVARGDVDGAVKRVETLTASLPESERNEQPQLLMAQIYAEAGRMDEAIAVLERARPLQSKETMTIDRELGALAFRAGKYEVALDAFKRALGSVTTDEGNRLLKAVAESQMMLGKFTEAEQTITQLGGAAQRDAELVMMLGQSAAGQKDAERARKFFDDAVRLSPSEPLVYYRRAEFALGTGDPSRVGDAIADLREALRRDARFAPARTLMINTMLAAGMGDEAVAELRKLVTDDPSSDDARAQLVNTLMARGRIDEALRAANEALERSPESVSWMLSIATIHMGSARPAEAVKLLQRAWGIQKTPIVAGYYANALMSQTTPDAAKALEVLAAPEAKTDQSGSMLLLRAWALGLLNKPEEMRANVQAAYRMTPPDDGAAVQSFMNGLLTAFKTQDAVRKVMKDLEPAGGHTGWFPIGIATMLQQDEATRPEAIAIFQAQVNAPNKMVAGSANRFLGNIAYVEKRYQDAAGYYAKALELIPQSAEVANNLAYALAVDLNRPSEALPHAELAARLLPRNSSALDTLGTVYLALDRIPEAEAALNKSLILATNPLEKASVYLHLAQLKLKQGNKSEAARFTDQLDTQVKGSADVAGAYAARVAELRQAIAAK